MSEQDELERRLQVIRFAAAVALAALLLLAGLLLTGARAADLPCPPTHYACWQVRLAVNSFGEAATIDHATACGWSEARIAQARKCLRPLDQDFRELRPGTGLIPNRQTGNADQE